jgi:hypothetical protein
MPEELNSAGRRNADMPVGKPAVRSADFPVGTLALFARRAFAGLLAWLRTACCGWACFKLGGRIRFQKYRVAPRLGTLAVRRRLLLGLHQQAPLSATRTALV